MKKFTLMIFAFFLNQTLFAKANIRLEASGGAILNPNNSSYDVMGAQLFGFGFNYEFELAGKNFLAVGADLCMPIPYAGLELSYIRCLQNSQSNYKFYFEPGIRAGTIILFPQDYTYTDENGNMQTGCSKFVFSPLMQINAMFSLKPQKYGFYFALGPQITMLFMNNQTSFEKFLLIPGVTLSAGYHF